MLVKLPLGGTVLAMKCRLTVWVRGRECLAITHVLLGEAGLPCEDQSCDIVKMAGCVSRRITCGPDTAEFCTALGSTATSDHLINLWNRSSTAQKCFRDINQGAVFLCFSSYFRNLALPQIDRM